MRIFALLLSLLPLAAQAADTPREALRWRSTLVREARQAWGIDAPVAVFAGQIHQESRWNPDAISRVGARGMAQFMPATERWAKQALPGLADGGATNPVWAMRALIRYDDYLIQHIPPERTDGVYALFWAALRSYNGGLGHWLAEAKNAKSARREDVDAACGTAKRHKSHCRENLNYPKRILVDLQPLYASWGDGVAP
ncbi:MAG: lytic transglycosylase [Burkholderiaceae bacterium]|nr:lytic transglycosylase [Burkholderiaceae bacterium]